MAEREVEIYVSGKDPQTVTLIDNSNGDDYNHEKIEIVYPEENK